LCLLVARHRFGASLFNTPLLLVLRFFYQACSFDLTNPRAGHGGTRYGEYRCRADDGSLTRKATSTPYPPPKKYNNFPSHFAQYEIFSATDWFKKLSAAPSTYKTYEVVSITWVKALASPLSHEFVQFVVEDTKTSTRNRVVADRHENGDWAIVGWDWASKKSPSDRHSISTDTCVPT
jgi:hypothetical protein